jgi:hypothetical protein
MFLSMDVNIFNEITSANRISLPLAGYDHEKVRHVRGRFGTGAHLKYVRRPRRLARSNAGQNAPAHTASRPRRHRGVEVDGHAGVVAQHGILCTGETYKDKVKLNFMKGASLPDPDKLFNASLGGNARRAINIHEEIKALRDG